MATSASRIQGRQPIGMRAATVLAFGAAPAFAVMAVVSGIPSGAMPVTCLGGMEGSVLGGMTSMYVMMSIFHLPPWLKLLAACHANRSV